MKSRLRCSALCLVMLIAVAQGCGGGTADDTQRESSAETPQRDRVGVALVVDPTVHLAADTSSWRKFLPTIRELYYSAPAGSCVSVIFVRKRAFRDGADHPANCFVAGRTSGAPKARLDSIATAWQTVQTELLAAWRQSNTPEGKRDATSCIITAMDRAARELHSGDYALRKVVVISDFLEVCDDWGDLNLERRIPPRTDLLNYPRPNLIELDSLIMIQLLHAEHVVTKDRADELAAFWRGALHQWGVDSATVIVRGRTRVRGE